MPYIARVLTNEDGPLILVRADNPSDALALAADEAADNDLIVTDEETDVRLGWIRAIPCRRDGHENWNGGGGYCEGGIGCHYQFGKRGPGAFRGAFVSARHMFAPEPVTSEPATGEG